MVAIVIPYYKLFFFERTLESLANQTDKRFTVYVGNDNSPENPEFIIEKFKNSFPLIYHKFNENLGAISLTKQWERCIALSLNEEWIMVLGDDDFLSENVIAQFYQNVSEVQANDCNLIRFATQIVDQNSIKKSPVYTHPKLETATSAFYRKLKQNSRSSLSEYIFKRNVYRQFKFRDFPLAWHSDDYAWLQFSSGKPLFAINDAVLYIGVSTSSISGNATNMPLKNKAEIEFFDYLINYKIHLFNKKEALDILYHSEVSFLNNGKISSQQWRFYWKLYLKNFQAIPFLKFVRRYFLSKLT